MSCGKEEVEQKQAASGYFLQTGSGYFLIRWNTAASCHTRSRGAKVCIRTCCSGQCVVCSTALRTLLAVFEQ